MVVLFSTYFLLRVAKFLSTFLTYIIMVFVVGRLVCLCWRSPCLSFSTLFSIFSFLPSSSFSYLCGFVCLRSLFVHCGAFFRASSFPSAADASASSLASHHRSIRLGKRPARLLEVGEGTYRSFFVSRVFFPWCRGF